MADCFCLQERKRDGTKWARGGYLLLANRHCPQCGEAVRYHCGLTAGSYPSALQSLSETASRPWLLFMLFKCFMAITRTVEAQNRDSPPAVLLVSRMGIYFLDHYWLMSTVISVLFFLCFSSGSFEVAMIPFSFPPSIEQLACTWSIDVSCPRGHLDKGTLFVAGNFFICKN